MCKIRHFPKTGVKDIKLCKKRDQDAQLDQVINSGFLSVEFGLDSRIQSLGFWNPANVTWGEVISGCLMEIQLSYNQTK